MHLISAANNRFHVSDSKFELIKDRDLKELDSASPMLTDFVYIDGDLYFFDFEEVFTTHNDYGDHWTQLGPLRNKFIYNISLKKFSFD